MGTDTSSGQSKRHGFSLVESAIVLAVIGLVLGGIWIASAAMYENYKVNKTVEGIISIKTGVQRLVSYKDANTIGIDNDLTKFVVEAIDLPASWKYVGYSLISPIGPATHITTHGGPTLSIDFYGVSKSQCIRLITRVSALQAPSASYTDRIGLGSIWVKDTDGGGAYTIGAWVFPITPAQADTGCSIKNNGVFFYFGYTRTN